MICNFVDTIDIAITPVSPTFRWKRNYMWVKFDILTVVHIFRDETLQFGKYMPTFWRNLLPMSSGFYTEESSSFLHNSVTYLLKYIASHPIT